VPRATAPVRFPMFPAIPSLFATRLGKGEAAEQLITRPTPARKKGALARIGHVRCKQHSWASRSVEAPTGVERGWLRLRSNRLGDHGDERGMGSDSDLGDPLPFVPVLSCRGQGVSRCSIRPASLKREKNVRRNRRASALKSSVCKRFVAYPAISSSRWRRLSPRDR